MSRQKLREQIFKLLFRIEFNSVEEMPEQLALFFDEEVTVEEAEKTEISEKYQAIVDKKDEIDAMLNEKATGWNVSRMGKIDVTILRLAVYEILFDEGVPAPVAINEAVELAKKFGEDSSAGFVNGVLAKFVKS